MSKNNPTNHSYDKRTIKVFLMHLAGELKLQEILLNGRPVPPNLQKGVSHLRAKFGVDLLPDAERLTCPPGDPVGKDDMQRNASRQALASHRLEQFKQVLAFISLLKDLEI